MINYFVMGLLGLPHTKVLTQVSLGKSIYHRTCILLMLGMIEVEKGYSAEFLFNCAHVFY